MKKNGQVIPLFLLLVNTIVIMVVLTSDCYQKIKHKEGVEVKTNEKNLHIRDLLDELGFVGVELYKAKRTLKMFDGEKCGAVEKLENEIKGLQREKEELHIELSKRVGNG